MMLDFVKLIAKYEIKPIGIIQLGVHKFQEKEVFQSIGVNDFVLVEPQKEKYNEMLKRAEGLNAICFNCAVSDYNGKGNMECDSINDGQSSSLLKPKDHTEVYPWLKFDHSEEVEVQRLENLDFDRIKYNILVMDLQGNELKALKGDPILLRYIDCIYTEVNFREMYEGCVLIDELDDYLKDFGFSRVETGPDYNNQGWSDAFYLKR